MVHRVTTTHIHTSADEKALNWSGDSASVAILQTRNDSEMTSPGRLRDVLGIVRHAFACPDGCV